MMKTFLLSLFLLGFSTAFVSELFSADPVLETSCQPGGEFGNIVTIKLSKDFRYGKLTVKRTLPGSDLTKDISTFVGGDYRLDLATKAGINGYTVEYAAKDPAAALTTAEGVISCGAMVPAPSSEPVPPVDPSPSPVPSPTPPLPTPEPQQIVPSSEAAPGTVKPDEVPQVTPTSEPNTISVEAGRL